MTGWNSGGFYHDSNDCGIMYFLGHDIVCPLPPKKIKLKMIIIIVNIEVDFITILQSFQISYLLTWQVEKHIKDPKWLINNSKFNVNESILRQWQAFCIIFKRPHYLLTWYLNSFRLLVMTIHPAKFADRWIKRSQNFNWTSCLCQRSKWR